MFHLRMGHVPHDDVDTPLSYSYMCTSKNATFIISVYNVLKIIYGYYINYIIALLFLYHL